MKVRPLLSTKKQYILLLLLLSFQSSFSQQIKQVIPPSPNVASLGKYGDIPVSLYSGIPNVSIPLYTIKSGPIELPISISYHAGGVKVEELSSSIGLGWSLNAGGVVGRNVRGLADEIGPWYPVEEANRVETIMMSSDFNKRKKLVEDVEARYVDGESDLYYYNFNGNSGKFFFDQAGNNYTMPQKKILITRNGFGWSITNTDGTVYTFEKVEQVNTADCSGDYFTYTAWYLASIKSSDGTHEITFTYEPVYYTYSTLMSQIAYLPTAGGGCLQNPIPCLGTHNYRTHRLTQINFSTGYVKFNYYNTRCDLVDDKSLDEIEIYKNDATLFKKFELKYDYFGDNTNGCDRATEQNKRLKLLSLTEKTSSNSIPPHQFYYEEETGLPSRLSFAQDHWGFYNGKVNNNGLIASYLHFPPVGSPIIFKGADRKADRTKTQAAILKRIVYPTGGETLFTYENNEVIDSRVEFDVRNEHLALNASNQLITDLPVPFESTSIVIPEPGATVEFRVSGFDSPYWAGCDIVKCYIIKDNNTISPFRWIGSTWDKVIESWPSGTYKIRVETDCGVDSRATFDVSIIASIATQDPTTSNKAVGGVRIKTIESKTADGEKSIIKEYKYYKIDDETQSSGVLVNFPDYNHTLNVERINRDEHGSPEGPSTFCTYLVRQSFSNYPLASPSGVFVGYEHVIEDLGENGQNHYTFESYGDLVVPSFPFAPNDNFDWRRGSLKSTLTYGKRNGSLFKVQEVTNNYIGLNEKKVYGIKTGNDHMVIDPSNPGISPTAKHLYFTTTTEFYELYKITQRSFDPNDVSKFRETVTEYSFNSLHLQPIEVRASSRVSGQEMREEVVTHKKYPYDYVFSTTPIEDVAIGIKKLQDLHVASAVIEEYTLKQNRDVITNQISNQRIVSGIINTFKTDRPYLETTYGLQPNNGKPILLSTFSPSHVSNNAFEKYGDYKPLVTYLKYDDKGNLITYKKADDMASSYLWGYDYNYPIAEVKNCENENEIAYTSFEHNSSGNWSFSGTSVDGPGGFTITGMKSYLLNGSNPITKNLLVPSNTYRLSYWHKNGASVTVTGGTQLSVMNAPGIQGWTLVTMNITGASALSISGSGYIDELRLVPVRSLITTYTYDPLIGISTSTDINHKTIYYKYDTFGRLMNTRDENNNLLKVFNYEYKKQ